MSFSGEVKKELCEQISPARHCRLAEISAIIAFCGKLVVDKDQILILKLQTESTILTKKIFLLLKQVFRVNAELTTKSISSKKNLYELALSAEETSLILEACKLKAAQEEKNGRPLMVEPTVVTKSCCRRLVEYI
jgi:DNA-binding protein WhiA